MTLARSLVYVVTFYVVTALFVVLGSWLLFGPRSWAMKGLEIHGRTCTWLLRVIRRSVTRRIAFSKSASPFHSMPPQRLPC